MTKTLQTQENLAVKQMIVDRLIVEDGVVKGVVGQTGATYLAKAVILATGTYLRGKVIIGEYSEECGPNGQRSAKRSPFPAPPAGWQDMLRTEGISGALRGQAFAGRFLSGLLSHVLFYCGSYIMGCCVFYSILFIISG